IFSTSLVTPFLSLLFFSFTYTAPTEIYTLSLHDALPIFSLHAARARPAGHQSAAHRCRQCRRISRPGGKPLQHAGRFRAALSYRSEEHTSELQSRENLVCRLLLEKKKKKKTTHK